MDLFLLGAPLLLYIRKKIGRRLEDNSFRAATKENRRAAGTRDHRGISDKTQYPVAVDDGKRWKRYRGA